MLYGQSAGNLCMWIKLLTVVLNTLIFNIWRDPQRLHEENK